MNTSPSHSMTSGELRASVALAAVFALRMLGLFLVLPVFSLSATAYEGGNDPALVGFAMGVYGLTQALLQWPFGLASDRFGRRRLIVCGLLVFALGSVVAALAESVWGLAAGRALQGAGAISAAITALVADHTRVQVRTKAMALVGISIGAAFSLALIVGPYLGARLGLDGLFWLVSVLAMAAIAVVMWAVPSAPAAGSVLLIPGEGAEPSSENRRQASTDVQRLSLPSLMVGVFVLHVVQMALWSGVPLLLTQAGLSQGQHWQLYLPAVLASVVFLGLVFSLERKGHAQWAMRLGVGLMLLSQVGLWAIASGGSMESVGWALGLALFAFFCGFNALEALQPSFASMLAAPERRGSVMGLYSTLQSLGLFVGGVMGGSMVQWKGIHGLFMVTGGATLAWLLLLFLWRKR